MLTLTQLIAQMQVLLGDDGTRFDTALCTAAIREALTDFNKDAPVHAAETLTAVSGQYEYELTDTTVLTVVDVLRQGTDTLAELHTPLGYNAYDEDGRMFIRLHEAEADDQVIIVRYTIPHTVSGLDGGTESTIAAGFDSILLDGACSQAAYAKATARVEEINLNPQVVQLYLSIANGYRLAFEAGIIMAARRGVASVKRTGWGV